jgi:hypothetical protein
MQHTEDQNETTGLQLSHEQTIHCIHLHIHYCNTQQTPQTFAYQEQNRSTTKQTIRNHAIRFNVPYKPLSRMDRQQTVINATRGVSPKHNNQFCCHLVTYIYVTGMNIPYNIMTNKFTYQHILHQTKTTRVQKQQQVLPLRNLTTNDLHISIRELRYYVSLFTIRQLP